MIGKPIHLAGARPGCVWILERIEGDVMLLRTPKTRRPFSAKADRALYVRRLEPKP
jgi:hypothetical protein